MATTTEAQIHAAVRAISAEYARIITQTLDSLAKEALAATKTKLQEYFILPPENSIESVVVQRKIVAEVGSLINGPKAGLLDELDDVIDTIVHSNMWHKEDGRTVVADVQFSVDALVTGRLRPLLTSVDALTLARVLKAVQGQGKITPRPNVSMEGMENVRLGLSLEVFLARLQAASVAGNDQISKAVTALH
ncbi:hypothetical protein BGZ52_006379 [Haplosporangium bisporale]|nr:hypothetical protein BGZ52_006379 [Haplosporangium bisporale]